MNRIGFSTGALAFGDFERGIALQNRPGIDAIELSALREEELDPLVFALDRLDLSAFEYCSFHAPSKLVSLNCAQLVEKLRPIADLGYSIVVHPDIIGDDFSPWGTLGDSLLLENMDSRKAVCRTADEMSRFFKELPEARFCLDLGHARQVDATMNVAFEFLHRYRNKLAEIHISEVNWQCQHRRIGASAALAFRDALRWIPEGIPMIIESLVSEQDIDQELETVRRCLGSRKSAAVSG